MHRGLSVIIPAYNEVRTIAHVISGVREHPSVIEIFVVDDGSTDGTAQRAREAGATVIELSQNSGKARAMTEGVRHAKENIFLFLDADVSGVSRDVVEIIAGPVLNGAYDMFVGICGRRLSFLNVLMPHLFLLAGCRAMTRDAWEKVPASYRRRFEIEIALNYFVERGGMRMGAVVVPQLWHIIKEVKRGIVRGFGHRLIMMWDVTRVIVALYIVYTLREAIRMLFQKPI